MQHQTVAGKALGDSDTRRKVVPVGIHQPPWIPLAAADENGGNAILENQVGVGIVFVIKRVGVFVAHTQVQARRRGYLPAIFDKRIAAPIA